MSQYLDVQNMLRIAEDNLNPVYDESGKVIEFTIDRRAWARGGVGYTAGNHLLNREEGTRCCLGFYGLACKISNRRMDNIRTFGELAEQGTYQTDVDGFPEQLAWLAEIYADRLTDDESDLRVTITGNDTHAATRLAMTNDSTTQTEEDREAAIIAGFAEQGIKVNFIN